MPPLRFWARPNKMHLTAMAAQPNIGLLPRMIYVAAGIGLMLFGFHVAEADWLRVAMPIGGAILLIQGLIGWCGTVALIRRASRSK